MTDSVDVLDPDLLIGRAHDLSWLVRMVDASLPIIVIAGPPNSGKTSIARIARRSLEAPDREVIGPIDVRSALGLLAARSRAPFAQTRARPGDSPSDAVAGAGAAAAAAVRTILLVDDFRPSAAVNSQLRRRAAAGAPLSFVMFTRAERHLPAGAVRVLEPMPRAAIAARFAEIGAAVDPPATESEIETWVDHVANDIGLAPLLMTALSFVRDSDD